MTDPQELINQATTICEAATPGPWGPIDDYDGVGTHHGWRGMNCPIDYGGHGGNGLVFATHEWDVGLKEADIEFIATSRTLLPQLAEALKESEGRRKSSDRLLAESVRDTCGQAESLASHAIEQHAKHIAELTRERDEARADKQRAYGKLGWCIS